MSFVTTPAWPTRAPLAAQLSAGIAAFALRKPLLGISNPDALETLVKQMVASVRRQDYLTLMLQRPIDPLRANPASDLFDPEKAAILHMREGRTEEAIWLIFLAVHFGKHSRHGWRMVRDVYSALGGDAWTWERVTDSPADFRAWLTANANRIGGSFGNHRKYESINGDRPTGTGAAVASYVAWIGSTRSQAQRFSGLVRSGGNDPRSLFNHFYDEMKVTRFGRLGKFDFLCLLGRIGLAPILPGRAYLRGASGPLRGARLLVDGHPEAPISEAALEDVLTQLDEVLQVGMQVMEDSLCNWQKSPTSFMHFKG